MDIKRGYVKWVDESGFFHKELLVLHPDLLEVASEKEKLEAESAWEMAGKPERPTLELTFEDED